MKKAFRKFANITSTITGSPFAFMAAFLVVIVWAFSGRFFNYSDTWQLVINTGTTIVTFLMVFLIQNTQNRDSKAVQLKLDELIRVTNKARDSLVSLENMNDAELALLDEEFNKIHDKHSSSDVLKALHSQIAAEKTRRHTLRDFFVNTGKAVGEGAQLLKSVGSKALTGTKEKEKLVTVTPIKKSPKKR